MTKYAIKITRYGSRKSTYLSNYDFNGSLDEADAYDLHHARQILPDLIALNPDYKFRLVRL